MKHLFTIFLLIFVINTTTFSQSYTLDTTFAVDTIIYHYNFMYDDSVYFRFIRQITEHTNGSVFITGADYYSNVSSVRLFENGNFDYNTINLGGSIHFPFIMSGDTLINYYGKTDVYGNFLSNDKKINISEDISLFYVYDIHSYNDGSFLLAGFGFKLKGELTDNEIVKLKPDGHVDTNYVFNPITIDEVLSYILKYDESRFIAAGNFYSWYGYPINSICRFNISDGSIDSSFLSPLSYGPKPLLVLPNGKIIVGGTFNINGNPNYYGLTRLNVDGSIDTTFNTFNGSHFSTYHNFINTICPTPDGGYLIGGNFNYYQGHYRGSIAKIDANGYLDTTVFNGLGFETCVFDVFDCSSHGVFSIIPAQNNKYYVGGEFERFNGLRVAPIVRLNGDQNFSVNEIKENKIKIYPNPASDKLTISSNSNISELNIYNISGSLIQKTKCDNKVINIDVSDLKPGIYLLHSVTRNEVYINKFIIVR